MKTKIFLILSGFFAAIGIIIILMQIWVPDELIYKPFDYHYREWWIVVKNIGITAVILCLISLIVAAIYSENERIRDINKIIDKNN